MTEIKAEKVVQQPQINEYEITEHKLDEGITVSIFDLGIEDLIYEKMFTLFEIVMPTENQLGTCETERQVAKDKILLETDFSKVLGKARTNKEEREAYMKNQLSKYDDKIEEKKLKLEFYENKIKILNDLISTKKIMLKLEGAIREE